MRTCCHCGVSKSPCWRRGPEEKPVLCNACGAHYLVKKSLSGYMPGQRASSVPASSIGSPAHSPRKSQQQPASSSQQHDGASPPHKQKQQRSHKRHAKRHALLQDSDTDTGTPTDLAMQEEDHSAGVVCSSMSPGATSSIQEQQDCLEYEHPAVVASSRKKSRLVACSVYEVDPYTESVLRCKRTFETADGSMVTVVRRMRKQLKPRASCST